MIGYRGYFCLRGLRESDRTGNLTASEQRKGTFQALSKAQTFGSRAGFRKQQDTTCGRAEGASREAVEMRLEKQQGEMELAGKPNRLSFRLQTKRIHLLKAVNTGKNLGNKLGKDHSWDKWKIHSIYSFIHLTDIY